MLNKCTPKIDWTEEECTRIVGVFDLLLKMDRKQNPNLYEQKEKTSNGRGKKSPKYK
jgi:hypothetical protein